MSSQAHWEGIRKEALYQRRAHAQQQMRAAGLDPCAKPTFNDEYRAQQDALARAARSSESSVPACDDNVWRSTYAGLTNDERQRRSVRYQEQIDENYSAKLPNRFSSVNYAQQW